MALRQDLQNLVEGFIDTQVVSRGLDERTIKAYQQDLEFFLAGKRRQTFGKRLRFRCLMV